MGSRHEPSGCGKTTALRMVAGLERITSGPVSLGGEVVNDVSPRRRDIAMVFQNYALYPHLPVYSNIGFALENAKVPKAERERRIRAAAETLGLGDLLGRTPRQLRPGCTSSTRIRVGRLPADPLFRDAGLEGPVHRAGRDERPLSTAVKTPDCGGT